MSSAATEKSSSSTGAPVLSEDWLALSVGLLFFAIASLGLVGFEPFGWGVKTNVWLRPAQILSAVSPKFAGVPGLVCLLLTYMVLTTALSAGALLLGIRWSRFIVPFTVVFFISYAS